MASLAFSGSRLGYVIHMFIMKMVIQKQGTNQQTDLRKASYLFTSSGTLLG